jgi:olfactory receptor
VLPCVLKYLDVFNYLMFCGTAFINNFVSEHCAIVSVSCLFVSGLLEKISSMMNFLTSCNFILITVMKIPLIGKVTKSSPYGVAI